MIKAGFRTAAETMKRLLTEQKIMLQQKLLNVNTSGQTKIDKINQMITITGNFYKVIYSKWDDCNVITLSS